ncbi:MAG TPA: hypothetical protein VII13_18735 [Vicinamibacteria bacterium]
MRASPRATATFTAAALLAGALAARADYRDSYRKGLEAVDKGNWPEVVRRMQEAAAEQPREGERVKLYGMRFEDYLPHYYLGLGRFQTGDCQGALQAWAASEGQGAVSRSGQYKTLVRNKQACETRLAQARPSPSPDTRPAGPDPTAVAQAVQAAEAQVARAAQLADAVGALASDPDLSRTWASEQALGGAEGQARGALGTARERLDSGRRKPDLAALVEARDLAQGAARQLEGVRREATARREAAARAAEKRLQDELRAANAAPGAGAPPAPLFLAAGAYFEGRYQLAQEMLAGPAALGGRAGAQALLLRAAARHALYLIGGEADDTLKQAALSDVASCRKRDPAFAPDPRFFSPRFRDFFRNGG